MFGPKLTTVFASRWKALSWAAFVLMTAYCAVPSPDEPDQGIGTVQALSGHKPDKGDSVPANPWAKDAP